MTDVLIAGVGNVFFGDDAFGVEVARRLADDPPPGSRVTDFGIRAVHLAYELLEPIRLCIIADCTCRGERPGSLYVIEPSLALDPQSTVADAHGMDLSVVFAAVRELGGRLPGTLVVGCEPASIDPGMGLSPEVARAVPSAVSLIRDLVCSPPRLERPT